MDLASLATPEVLFVLLAALSAGCIDSMVGSGGLIQMPALFSAFPTVPHPTLLGTNKLSSIFGAASAVARFARSVHIPWRTLLAPVIFSFVFSLAGAWTVSIIPPDVFRPLIPILLTVVLIYVVRHRHLGSEHTPRAQTGAQRASALLLIGAIGFYDGFFGPGTGTFFLLVYVRLFGFDFLHSAACGRVLNGAANAAALLYFGLRGNIIWPLGAAMALCNVGGAMIGTRLAIRRGSPFIRRVFLLVVIALIVRTVWDVVRSHV